MDSDSTPLPASARLAWWGTAWLNGRIGPDSLLDGLTGRLDVGPDTGPMAHVVIGEADLLAHLALARAHGAIGFAAAFPAAGEPVGVRGPSAFTTAAIEAGEAVLLLGTGRALVPQLVGYTVEWTSYEAAPRPPLDAGEADRGLRSALLAAANRLAELDVPTWAPEVADELIDLRSDHPLHSPPGIPGRVVDLASKALRLSHVVQLAQTDDGGALSVVEIEQRRAAIEPLDRAVRVALTAAFSPDGWPPA